MGGHVSITSGRSVYVYSCDVRAPGNQAAGFGILRLTLELMRKNQMVTNFGVFHSE